MKGINLMKLFLLVAAFLFVQVVDAVPARPGLWRTIITSDGTEVCAQLCGDERSAFWLSDDGRRFVAQADGSFNEVTSEGLSFMRQKSQMGSRQHRAHRLAAGARHIRGSQPTGDFRGQRRGLIILAQFQDKEFAPGHDREFFDSVANATGFSQGGFQGSVRDYFLSQSRGLFDLQFDVVGPVTVAHDYAYYGQPGTTDVDARPWEMVVEACDLVKNQVVFSSYDWDGDGFVEQVFVLYAGQGQSDSYDVNTIWPHEYELSQVTESGIHLYGQGHSVGDGLTIDTYACSNELTSQNTISGIGTICHEFSHCMGLPDLYDVDYNGYFGMGHWDVMSTGVYNGQAFLPAGYTSYERMVCGWLQPIELSTDTLVDQMEPLADGGQAYVIYNEGWPDEYYLLENRQPTGWDRALPGSGLLVLHVDYDERVWRENIVNSVCDFRSSGYPDLWNTHQRLTLIHADNENDKRFWKPAWQSYTQTTEQTDAYPYLWTDEQGNNQRNDSLTNNSLPAAVVYHPNTDKLLFMNRGLQQITQQTDAIISFRFEAVSEKYVAVDTTLTEKPDLTGAIFYESFDRCIGTGGNDGVFKGNSSVASADFLPDNGGWESMVMGGGARCAKFGNAANDGIVSTPTIMLTADSVQLTFKAAPWSKDDSGLDLSISGDASLSQTHFEMVEGQWTTFTTDLTGSGPVVITFTPGRRFFLDEVVLRRRPDTAGMWLVQKSAASPSTDACIYDLGGRRLKPQKGRRGLVLGGAGGLRSVFF